LTEKSNKKSIISLEKAGGADVTGRQTQKTLQSSQEKLLELAKEVGRIILGDSLAQGKEGGSKKLTNREDPSHFFFAITAMATYPKPGSGNSEGLRDLPWIQGLTKEGLRGRSYLILHPMDR